MVKTCSTWPLLNKYALKKIWTWSSDPTVTSDPLYSLWKRQKLKIWILFLPWSKFIHSSLKGIIITFKQNLDVIYRPHGRVLSLKWLFLVKNGNFFTFGCCGVRTNFPLNVFSVPFRLNEYILNTARRKFKFSNFAFSIAYVGGLG